MKGTKIRKEVEGKTIQCALCQANFEVWLDNIRVNPDMEDSLNKHFLNYCPVCTKKAEGK